MGSTVTDTGPSPAGKGEQVDSVGSDVFSHGSGGDFDSLSGEFSEELFVKQVNLAKVRRGGILTDAVTVANGGAAMGVALNAKAGEQRN